MTVFFVNFCFSVKNIKISKTTEIDKTTNLNQITRADWGPILF